MHMLKITWDHLLIIDKIMIVINGIIFENVIITIHIRRASKKKRMLQMNNDFSWASFLLELSNMNLRHQKKKWTFSPTYQKWFWYVSSRPFHSDRFASAFLPHLFHTWKIDTSTVPVINHSFFFLVF